MIIRTLLVLAAFFAIQGFSSAKAPALSPKYVFEVSDAGYAISEQKILIDSAPSKRWSVKPGEYGDVPAEVKPFLDWFFDKIKDPALEVTTQIDDDVKNEHVEKWAQKAKGLVEEWYPKLVDLLGTPEAGHVDKVNIHFKKMDGVAYSSGKGITISAAWITDHADDAGMVVHELVHVVQAYHRRGTPGWVVEGIADYIRFFIYEKPAIPRVTEKSKYTDSYRVTGAFFNWIVVKYDKDFVKKLNAAARAGKYSDELFKESTGKPIDELWTEYAQEKMAAKK